MVGNITLKDIEKLESEKKAEKSAEKRSKKIQQSIDTYNHELNRFRWRRGDFRQSPCYKKTNKTGRPPTPVFHDFKDPVEANER